MSTDHGALPRSVAQAFRLAASELGHVSASWLVVDEIERSGGREALENLREELGRGYAVLDAVVGARLRGQPMPGPARLDEVLALCEGAEHVVFVGIEARLLDAVIPRLAGPTLHLVTQSILSPDWDRVASNYDGRLELTTLQDFQRWGGPRSVIITPVYGTSSSTTFVVPAWIRVAGPDVRVQFRALIGWEVLSEPFTVYPRWLVEAPLKLFSHVVRA